MASGRSARYRERAIIDEALAPLGSSALQHGRSRAVQRGTNSQISYDITKIRQTREDVQRIFYTAPAKHDVATAVPRHRSATRPTMSSSASG